MDRPHPALTMSDDDLLDEIFLRLTLTPATDGDPYSDDGEYAAGIKSLPVGLRAMAATKYLNVSLTFDDIGWHFLNFGEAEFVKETESGLRELGLNDMADWFVEAHSILKPLRDEIANLDRGRGFYECLERHGHRDRMDALSRMAWDKQPKLRDSAILSAWVTYARQHPQDVFGDDI